MQRVWIALEAKGMSYQYIEVDPYAKPKELLDVNPRGLVPGMKVGNWGCGESTVLMEYVRVPVYLTPFSEHRGPVQGRQRGIEHVLRAILLYP